MNQNSVLSICFEQVVQSYRNTWLYWVHSSLEPLPYNTWIWVSDWEEWPHKAFIIIKHKLPSTRSFWLNPAFDRGSNLPNLPHKTALTINCWDGFKEPVHKNYSLLASKVGRSQNRSNQRLAFRSNWQYPASHDAASCSSICILPCLNLQCRRRYFVEIH